MNNANIIETKIKATDVLVYKIKRKITLKFSTEVLFYRNIVYKDIIQNIFIVIINIIVTISAISSFSVNVFNKTSNKFLNIIFLKGILLKQIISFICTIIFNILFYFAQRSYGKQDFQRNF